MRLLAQLHHEAHDGHDRLKDVLDYRADVDRSHATHGTAAMQLLLDYRDLGGRQYATSAVITVNTDQNGQRTLSFYDVRTFRDKTLTTHGDSLPQPGLRPLPMDKQG